MTIYGSTLLSVCLLAGVVCGRLIGALIGVKANVGGVGVAMVLLIYAADRLRAHGRLNAISQGGIIFWSSIYIPIVVAMAASQNAAAAMKAGWVSFFAGTSAVAAGFLLVPLIGRVDRVRSDDVPSRSVEAEMDRP